MKKTLAQRLQAAIAKNQKHHPEAVLQLNAGADDSELAALEAMVGAPLPDGFKAIYRDHNGQRSDSAALFNGEVWLDLGQMAQVWTVWKDLYDSQMFSDEHGQDQGSAPDSAAIQALWWSPLWLPFSHDGAGNHLCVDLSPTAEGTYGQVIQVWHGDAERSLQAASFEQWLEPYVEGMEESDFVYDASRNAIVDAELLYAEDSDGDVQDAWPADESVQATWQEANVDIANALSHAFDSDGASVQPFLQLVQEGMGGTAADSAQWAQLEQVFKELEQEVADGDGVGGIAPDKDVPKNQL